MGMDEKFSLGYNAEIYQRGTWYFSAANGKLFRWI